jgi:hypothetical protein
VTPSLHRRAGWPARSAAPVPSGATVRLGQLGGFPLLATVVPRAEDCRIALVVDCVLHRIISVPTDDIAKIDPSALVSKPEHRLAALDRLATRTAGELTATGRDAARGRSNSTRLSRAPTSSPPHVLRQPTCIDR